MQYEVENKYPVANLAELERRLIGLGASIGPPVEQVDRYYAHPSRDFAATDEALRLRRIGDANRITYKGPKLDQTTKTRREIELPLGPGQEAEAQWSSLLEALGFRPVAEVRKLRRACHIHWQDREVEGTLDHVAPLGDFMELELTVDASQLDSARSCIQSLAQALSLGTAERRSYLELLLASRESELAQNKLR